MLIISWNFHSYPSSGLSVIGKQDQMFSDSKVSGVQAGQSLIWTPPTEHAVVTAAVCGLTSC